MNADGEDLSRASGFVPYWAILVPFAIIAYPLSIGPMIWLCEQGVVAEDNPFWTAFYAPLVYVMQHSDLLANLMVSYFGWWVS